MNITGNIPSGDPYSNITTHDTGYTNPPPSQQNTENTQNTHSIGIEPQQPIPPNNNYGLVLSTILGHWYVELMINISIDSTAL